MKGHNRDDYFGKTQELLNILRFNLEISEKFQTLYGISCTFRIIGFTSMNPEKIAHRE